MEAILNFSDLFDIELFEKVVKTLYESYGQEQQNAQRVITKFQEHPDSWTKVDAILEHTKSLQCKFIALQILERLVQTRWNALPREQCLGIRNYIVTLIIRVSSDEANLVKESVYVNKLNSVLIKILKYEWPKEWPSFIPELVASSRTSVGLCENNMVILKLLSEEIFDFSADQMTTVKAKNMKQQFCGEFSAIFELLSEVLEKSQKTSLIKAALESLMRFLRWIPFGYIFETGLIERLVTRFLVVPAFRCLTLACLTEIVWQPVTDEYNSRIVQLFHGSLACIQKMFPMTHELDLARCYAASTGEIQIFIQNLNLFLTTVLERHLGVLEAIGEREDVLLAHFYLLKISLVDDKEVFKVCVEYWTKLVGDLYKEFPLPQSPSPLLLGPLVQTNGRRAMYADVMTQLRHVMINRMMKPEEVLIVEDENGDVIRETRKELESIALYNAMKEILVYLTHLDYEDIESIMRTKLELLFDPINWSFNSINQLCWAIGSISGAMNEAAEKSFLVFVISKLLSLCELKKGKSNKAIVAANVMYVVGQYPRFLKSHWKFLKTVLNKLFEFMHESHPGVQDMACETFLKIAQKCKRHICTSQSPNERPFVEEIIANMPAIVSDLSNAQIQVFYEAVATAISAQHDADMHKTLLESLMEGANASWSSIVQNIAASVDYVTQPDTYKAATHLLRCNISVCVAIGAPFGVQMAKIYMDMLALYRTASGIISAQVAAHGIGATKSSQMIGLRTIKKDVLRLINVYISKIDNAASLVDTFIPPLFEAILGDYSQNVEQAKDAEVLNVTATAFTKFEGLLARFVPPVLDAVFKCTLQMISRDFIEYPEHRVGFFTLLAAINNSCFVTLMQLNDVYFKLIIDSIVWAFKHAMRDIAELGLQICQKLLNNVVSQPNAAFTASFFQKYYLSLMQDIFFVLTDSSQKSGFKFQAEILAFLFNIVTTHLSVPLSSAITATTTATVLAENRAFVRKFVVDMLKSGFPNVHAVQIDTFVNGLFDLKGDLPLFKSHLRDFLIQSKEFSKDDPDLFRDEYELEQQRKSLAEKDAAARIPGLIKPADIDDDDDD